MTDLPPRVEARVVPPGAAGVELSDESVAVELCVFRLCDWHSADVRASTREQRDDAYRAHLRAEHLDDLARLVEVLQTPPESLRVLGLVRDDEGRC